ncbi:MAG: BrnT family toxin [Terriglobia bacterium]
MDECHHLSMAATIAGFDWDDGNRTKCLKHGVSAEELESLFLRPVMILPDEGHSRAENRFTAVGQTATGRSIFLVFTIREKNGKQYIRPISARYMHKEEVQHYEKENPNF